MSNVPITDAASATRKVDTIQRTDGPDTVETQAVAIAMQNSMLFNALPHVHAPAVTAA